MDTDTQAPEAPDLTAPFAAAAAAAEAVAHALPPQDLDALIVEPLRTSMFIPDADATPERWAGRVLTENMLGAVPQPEGHKEWWAASGTNVTAALCSLTGLDEGAASHLVAAAVIARALAGRDRSEDGVLRLAERAAMWSKGREDSATLRRT